MNPYEILGVKHTDDEKTIKDAYRKLLKKYHPDTPTGDSGKFQQVQEAYEKINTKNTFTSGTKSSNINIDEIFNNYHFGNGFKNMRNIVSLTTTVSANDAEYGCTRFFKIQGQISSIQLPPRIKIGSVYSASVGDVDVSIKVGFNDPDYEYDGKLIKNERVSAHDFFNNSHVEVCNHKNEKYKVAIKDGMTTQQLLRIPKAGLGDEPLYIRLVVVK
jgi:curved DNA-binding protein CbpA